MSVFEKERGLQGRCNASGFSTLRREVSDKERNKLRPHVANCNACAAPTCRKRAISRKPWFAALQPADELDSSGILLSQCP